MTFSADGLVASIFCLIVIPSKGYDEPENLLSQLAKFCLIGADAGQLAGVGALLLTARTGSGEPNLGGNLTLEAIAAAVVGGVRLSGGEGGVGAAVLGALFVTVLSNGMNLVQIDGYLQQICLGIIIIISLIISRDEFRR